MKIFRITVILFALTALSACKTAHHNDLSIREKIKNIIDSSGGIVGVSVNGIDFPDTLSMNNAHNYPMQSTFKFPLALAILHDVESGKLKLDQKVHIPKDSLDTMTWSPMVKDFPKQDIDMTVWELLRYSVSKSDNNACDILFNLAGGTSRVNDYIHSLGVADINIAATEKQMKQGWNVQYTNWCHPTAMTQLLTLFYNGRASSASKKDTLMKLMVKSENSPKRLKGLLPADAIVAHKTGTSNTNKEGITAATNDIGIVTLPDGRHYAIAVYVSDCKGGEAEREHTIAAISKAVWEFERHKEK